MLILFRKLAIYRKYGISTDHESENAKQALERLNAGFAVFVRYTKSPSALHWAEGNFFPFCMQIHG